MMFENSIISDSTQKASAMAVENIHHNAATDHGGQFDFVHLLDHIKDSKYIETPFGYLDLPKFEPIKIGNILLDLSPTKHVFFLLLCAFLLLIIGIYAARKARKSSTPSGLLNFIEVFVVFIRDEIAIANMGHSGIKYVPYLITTFFYILFMNLCGLIPFGSTATGNIMVTAGLAIIAFIMIQYSAIRAQGVKHYLQHLTGGVHWLLWPIMIPIEILGLFTKPFALCMRLFANMTGGHIVILSLLGLIFVFKSFVIAPIPVMFVVAIYLLEIFVAFLQAYVFTMLTALFMGLGMKSTAKHEENTH